MLLVSGSTVCPGSSDPFYSNCYNIEWVTTSWTHTVPTGKGYTLSANIDFKSQKCPNSKVEAQR